MSWIFQPDNSNLAEYELDKSTGEGTRIDIIGQNGNDTNRAKRAGNHRRDE